MVAVAALSMLILVGWSLYHERFTRIVVSVVSLGDQPALDSMSVHVRRGAAGSDEIDVIASVPPATATGATTLIISVSSALKYVGPPNISGLWNVQESVVQEGVTDYHIKSISNKNTGCHLTFRGEIFPKQPTVNSQFTIFSSHNGKAFDLPTEFYVADLGTLTLDHLIPQPEQRTVRFIGYSANSWLKKTGDGTVTLRGVDRVEFARYQFWFFLLATLIGVFASFIMNGLHTFILEYDQSRFITESQE